MSDPRVIVLDANVLIRAVLGKNVPALLTAYEGRVRFVTPDSAFDEARRHLPSILDKRGQTADGINAAMDKLTELPAAVAPISSETYELMKRQALARIGQRDPDDWPVLACALLLGCPIWTEDADFFGTGVATWTTRLVHLYLSSPVVPTADDAA